MTRYRGFDITKMGGGWKSQEFRHQNFFKKNAWASPDGPEPRRFFGRGLWSIDGGPGVFDIKIFFFFFLSYDTV